ncbi:MAG: alkaline phosphatase family protein [Candidatus Cybelea sp.]
MASRWSLILALVFSATAITACGGEGSRTPPLASGAVGSAGFADDSSPIEPGSALFPDHIIVIVMENHSLDDIVGATNVNGHHLFAPFLTQAAQTDRLATMAFGVAHPSLPNYLSMISGDFFGVHDDNGSCYAPGHPRGCHSFTSKNLVDSLEAAGLTWASYNQSMPRPGYLAQEYPHNGDGLYRQKHNPFVYFKDIATSPKRLTNVETFVDLEKALSVGRLPNFSYIVPDECHDMHGSSPYCPGPTNRLIAEGDTTAQKLVQEIIGSGAFTEKSLLFITWDEGDNNLGCCDAPPLQSGGHIPLILITSIPGAVRSARLYNHYSLLATIEDVWKLPKLGYTSDTKKVKPMLDLLPSQ